MAPWTYRAGMDISVLGPLRVGPAARPRSPAPRSAPSSPTSWPRRAAGAGGRSRGLAVGRAPTAHGHQVAADLCPAGAERSRARPGRRAPTARDRGRRLPVGVRAEDVDAHRFARLVRLGRDAQEQGRASVAVATFRDALDLWRGPAYAGFESTVFGQAEARRLGELRLGPPST